MDETQNEMETGPKGHKHSAILVLVIVLAIAAGAVGIYATKNRPVVSATDDYKVSEEGSSQDDDADTLSLESCKKSGLWTSAKLEMRGKTQVLALECGDAMPVVAPVVAPATGQ